MVTIIGTIQTKSSIGLFRTTLYLVLKLPKVYSHIIKDKNRQQFPSIRNSVEATSFILEDIPRTIGKGIYIPSQAWNLICRDMRGKKQILTWPNSCISESSSRTSVVTCSTLERQRGIEKETSWCQYFTIKKCQTWQTTLDARKWYTAILGFYK